MGRRCLHDCPHYCPGDNSGIGDQMIEQNELPDELKAQLLEKLLVHLQDRIPFFDAFVYRILTKNPDALHFEPKEWKLPPNVGVNATKLVELAIRDFLFDAFGKIHLVYPPSDTGENSP